MEDFNQTNVEIRFENEFEFKIALVVGITFSITFFVGLVGNSLVLLTVLLQQTMRNATNILILNLALVELLFIILCVPFTGKYIIIFGAFIICSIFFINSYTHSKKSEMEFERNETKTSSTNFSFHSCSAVILFPVSFFFLHFIFNL